MRCDLHLPQRDISCAGNRLLPFVRGHPAAEPADRRILRLIGKEESIVFRQQRVFPRCHRLLGGLDTVDCQKLDLTAVFVHIGSVGIDRVTNRLLCVVVDGDDIHQSDHGGRALLGRSFHQWGISHKINHVILAAGVVVALIGDNWQVFAAQLLPVGDAAGVDGAQLLLGQRVDGIVCVDHKDKALLCHRHLLELNLIFFGIFPLHLGKGNGEGRIYRAVDQMIKAVVGGGVDDLLACLLGGNL